MPLHNALRSRQLLDIYVKTSDSGNNCPILHALISYSKTNIDLFTGGSVWCNTSTSERRSTPAAPTPSSIDVHPLHQQKDFILKGSILGQVRLQWSSTTSGRESPSEGTGVPRQSPLEGITLSLIRAASERHIAQALARRSRANQSLSYCDA